MTTAPDELQSKFRDLADAVVDELLDNPNFPGQNIAKVTFESESQTSIANLITPDYLGWVQKNKSLIESLDEFHICKDTLFECEIIDRHHRESPHNIDSILLRFPAKLLSTSSSRGMFSNADFEQVYSTFKEDLFSDTLPTRVYIPLQAVRYSEPQIEFEDGSRIRRISEEDIENVLNIGAVPSDEIPWDWKLSWYLFETWYQRPKSASSYQEQKSAAQEKIQQLLTTLRLSFPGNVGYGTKYEERCAAWEWDATGYNEKLIQPKFANDYLSIEDKDEIKQLYHLMDHKDFDTLDPPLRMSIDRFNESFLRENPKIAFADLVIVLEALFNKTTDVAQKGLAQRVATLLGENEATREEIFDDIVDAYTERSAVWGIGHGTGREAVDENLLNQVEDYTRQSLKQILRVEDSYGSIENLIQAMEDEMVTKSLSVDFSP